MQARTRFAALAAGLALAAPVLAQSTTRISVSSSGAQATNNSFRPSLSADGRYVVFDSTAPNLVAGDTNAAADVFVRDRLLGTTARVSLDSSGAQGNGYSYGAELSADARFVVFLSTASNLVPGDTNGTSDAFVRDLVNGLTTRVSVSSSGVQGNDYSSPVFLSGDGRYVGFYSQATNLVAGDTNGQADAFVHDRQTGQTTRVSVSTSGAQANAFCTGCGVSADGRYAVFFSAANTLVSGDTNGGDDVFVRDLVAGTTARISVDSSGAQGNGNSGGFLLTPDARYVLFSSSASNLVPGDTNGVGDVFVRDMLSGSTTRVSLDSLGQQVDDSSGLSALSDDGRFVVFLSTGPGFVPGDTNGVLDVFVRDRGTGQTSRASVGSTGAQGNSYSYGGRVSADGRLIAFESGASNLVSGDTAGFDDIFLRDRGAIATTAFCFGDGTQASPCPCANAGAGGHGCENSAGTGGALLSISGFADPDSAVLSASGMLPGALSIFLQGNVELAPGVGFGDGLRCAGGTLKRLYVKSAAGGAASAPVEGDLPLGVQSGLLGDPLAPGTSRWYQTWYRDAVTGFCPAPAGDLWNVSNGVRVDW
jgi:Tol biopolymer transport system component